ncbi:hypothetical protein FNU76_22065 [Chitinimonas arctica]|uniref:Uncharacterized protein n=1 Tax=Chitinimonas arctica TaxID=2594795 RepID=A0A516SKY4_9NEIS|nr:hypothetical protein [Chitinimonas arctica]QDQ28820.1 hypothetical protein FNU76_22065 [Chitinimonas arctica]
MANVPNRDDWGDLSDFDVAYAYEKFGGRSRSEIQLEFAKNVVPCASDIAAMPPVPFQYYLLGLGDYVLSENYGRQSPSDVADSFIWVVEARAEDDPATVRVIINEINAVLDFLTENQSRLEICEEIYGDLGQRTEAIRIMATEPGE